MAQDFASRDGVKQPLEAGSVLFAEEDLNAEDWIEMENCCFEGGKVGFGELQVLGCDRGFTETEDT